MRLTLFLAALALLCSSAQAQYGVEFTAADTFQAVGMDSTAEFPVHIKNTGSVQDSFLYSYPRQNMPPNWVPLFCDDKICYGVPFNFRLDPGDTFKDHPKVKVIAFQDPGTGWVVGQVRSWGDTTQFREIRFWVTNQTGVEESGQADKGKKERGYLSKPNPFTSFAVIPGHEGESFVLYDIAGRMVERNLGSRVGEHLSPGVYFLKPQNAEARPFRIVKAR